MHSQTLLDPSKSLVENPDFNRAEGFSFFQNSNNPLERLSRFRMYSVFQVSKRINFTLTIEVT